MKIEEARALMFDLESDRVERMISFREDKLGPVVCAFSNDFSNHRRSGFIIIGASEEGSVSGITIVDNDLQKIENIKVLPHPVLGCKSNFPH